MNIKRKRSALLEDTYKYLGRASKSENTEIFKAKFKTYISTLKNVIESDIDKLTDKELYKLLEKIYSISFDGEDYLEVLSKCNNKQYTYIHKIPTKMIFTDVKNKEHDGVFDWWNQIYQIHLFAATSDQFKFNDDKMYSIEEINELLSSGDIVILNYRAKAIDNNKEFVQDNYESTSPLDIEIMNHNNDMSKFISNNSSLFGELLRKRCTKKSILKDVGEFVNDLNREIKYVFLDSQAEDPYYSETAKMCKEWFESSDAKIEYQNIQKTLKLTKRNNN